MGKNTRDRITRSRQRLNFRKYINFKNALIVSVVTCIAIISTTAISTMLLKEKVEKSTVKYNEKDTVDIYMSIAPEEKPVEEPEEKPNENEKPSDAEEKPNLNNNTVKISLLGEIMMGR